MLRTTVVDLNDIYLANNTENALKCMTAKLTYQMTQEGEFVWIEKKSQKHVNSQKYVIQRHLVIISRNK